jgi:hypothetical protein
MGFSIRTISSGRHLYTYNERKKFSSGICTPTMGEKSSVQAFVHLQREKKVEFMHLYTYNGRKELSSGICTPTTGEKN